MPALLGEPLHLPTQLQACLLSCARMRACQTCISQPPAAAQAASVCWVAAQEGRLLAKALQLYVQPQAWAWPRLLVQDRQACTGLLADGSAAVSL